MRLSHEELVFLNKFSSAVLKMREKYSDLDAIVDPLTLAFADYLTYGEELQKTQAVYRRRGVPFDKKVIFESMHTGTDSQGNSLHIDKDLAFACRINLYFTDRKIKNQLFCYLTTYFRDTGVSDYYLAAALSYFGHDKVFAPFHYFDPDEDAVRNRVIIKENTIRANALDSYDCGVDLSLYEDDNGRRD